MAKRAAQGAGTIRKKTVTRDGKQYTYWEARLTIGRDPGTGKQLQKSYTGQTQKEVREKLQAAAVSVNQNDYFEPSKMTLSRWCEIWLSEYMGDKKYGTVKHYKAMCKTHIVPKLGAVKLADLTTPQIQTFYNGIELAPKSVKNIHVILSKCLSTAISVGYLRNNPASACTLPKVTKKEIHPLTDEQIKAFLTIVDEDRYANALKTILFTGMREGEAMGLSWDCVDYAAGTLKINKQLQKRPVKDGGYTLTTPKNGKARIIKPARFVMDILKAQEIKQKEERLKAGAYWQGWKSEKERKTSLVFLNELGTEVNPKVLYLHYKKYAKRIDAPDSRVHDLRHTYAVMAIQNGDDIKTVQENLGHASAAFTLDIYAHVSERMRDDSAERMQRYIDGICNL